MQILGRLSVATTIDITGETNGANLFLNGQSTDAFVDAPTIVELNVENVGNQAAADVEVVITVPPELEPTDVTWGEAGARCGLAGHIATCRIGTLDGQSAELIRVTATGISASPAATLTATATSTATEPSPDPFANTASVALEVGPATADLSVYVIWPPRAPELGEQSTVVFGLSNDGPSGLTDVDVALVLPVGHRLESIEGATNTGLPPDCAPVSNRVDCRLPRLDAGGFAGLTLTTTPIASQFGSLSILVGSDAVDPAPNNNQTSLNFAAATLAVGLTPHECDVLAQIGTTFGHGEIDDVIRVGMLPVLSFLEANPPASGSDPGETCARQLTLSAEQLAGLQATTSALELPIDEAVEQVAEFLVALWTYYFES